MTYSPNSRPAVDDVIGNAIGSAGKASKKNAPPSRKVVAADHDENEISRIRRMVKKEYSRDFNAGKTDRILSAIEYLTINYPGILLPMTLLYWMCEPGSDFLSSTHNDVLLFAKRAARCRNAMIPRYGRTFYRDGHSKINAGFFRGYINKEELAKYEFPKAGRNLKKAFGKAEALGAAVGNVSSLKTNENFTSEHKDEAKDFSRIVASIGQAIKGYLPAPAPKPTTPKPQVSN